MTLPINVVVGTRTVFFHPIIKTISTIGGARKAIERRVAIDVKPGSDDNSLNPNAKGVLPIAILSSDTFDALEVDPGTLFLTGGVGKVIGTVNTVAKVDRPLCHEEDVSGDPQGATDGLPDLVYQFEVTHSGSEPETSAVVLVGDTFSRVPFRGEDVIRIVPPIWK